MEGLGSCDYFYVSLKWPCIVNYKIWFNRQFHILWKKCTNLRPLLFFYHFLFILGSTAHRLYHKQKALVLLCKVGQTLLCALQCHWLATSTSVNILWLTVRKGQLIPFIISKYYRTEQKIYWSNLQFIVT